MSPLGGTTGGMAGGAAPSTGAQGAQGAQGGTTATALSASTDASALPLSNPGPGKLWNNAGVVTVGT